MDLSRTRGSPACEEDSDVTSTKDSTKYWKILDPLKPEIMSLAAMQYAHEIIQVNPPMEIGPISRNATLML